MWTIFVPGKERVWTNCSGRCPNARKTVKYEFKATGRICFPYGAMVLVGVDYLFFSLTKFSGASQAIFTMMYIGICIVSVVITPFFGDSTVQ